MKQRRVIAYLVLALAMAWSNAAVVHVANRADETSKANAALAIRVAREAQARVNESCMGQETRYRAGVASLQRTYNYLESLTPEERKTTLNKFITSGLGRQEASLKNDKAPKFCDKPGVGLPEPNPDVPSRPSTLKGG